MKDMTSANRLAPLLDIYPLLSENRDLVPRAEPKVGNPWKNLWMSPSRHTHEGEAAKVSVILSWHDA